MTDREDGALVADPVAPEVSAALVAAVEAQLAEHGQADRWDVAAAHPFGDPRHGYVIRGARLGPGSQPFVTIEPGDPAAVASFPELLAHLAYLAAQAFIEYGRRFDAGQVDQSGEAGPPGRPAPG